MKINASAHATRGYVIATLRGEIIEQGPINEIAKLIGGDTLHCHDDDEAEVARLVDELTRPPTRQQTVVVAKRTPARKTIKRL